MKGRKSLPSHDHFAKRVMLIASQGFCQNVRPIVISVHLNHFNKTLSNLVFKMMPFDSNVFGTRFANICGSKSNSSFIIFINCSSRESIGSSGVCEDITGKMNQTMMV
jgi:hypothetical protein